MDESDPPVLIRRVIERFRGRPGEIVRHFLADDGFRSLCEAYELAAATLRRLETVERLLIESRIREYRGLLEDLEREIAQELSRLRKGDPR